MGGAREKELCPGDLRAQFLDLLLGPPDGLALLWGQISRVRPEFPRLFFSLLLHGRCQICCFYRPNWLFALLLWKPELVVWGECVCLRGLEQGVSWKWWRTRAGWRPWACSEWGQQEQSESSGKALPTWAVTLFRELLISHGAHLGNRHLFVDLQGSPGSSPALQWNIWKALAPPCAKAAEPWRQRSMTSSWLLLNPCPGQVFFCCCFVLRGVGRNQWVTQVFDAKSCGLSQKDFHFC